MHSISSRGDVALNDSAKELLFRVHCQRGAMAIDAKGKERPLSECDINEVKFIAGLWRIQNKFDHKIQMVRGQKFVLLEKINRIEKNLFEFYRGAIVSQNCYGYFIIPGADNIVAKYETDDETFWAYGNTLEQARAFMGICLYDKYQDLIHATACKNKYMQK